MASVVNIHAMITKTVKQLCGSYKFVLAFGNSLCKEYPTEKLFYLFQEDFNIIPVVRGAPDTATLYQVIHTYLLQTSTLINH
jgi:hypothetical protein